MEYPKIVNLLGSKSDTVPRFITKKLVEVHHQFNDIYSINWQIRLKTLMLQSDLCDYRDACIVVKGTITVTKPNNTDAYDKKLAFKNNATFISCISKINNTLIDNAKYLYLLMAMHTFIEYSKIYRKTTGSLWNYFRDEPNSEAEGNINNSIKTQSLFITKQVLQEN